MSDDDDDDDDDDMRVRVRETGGLQAGRCCPAPVRTINHQTSDRSQLAAGRRLLISVSCLSWVTSHHTTPRPDMNLKNEMSSLRASRAEQTQDLCIIMIF